MIIRAMGLGFLLWLAIVALFRFAGHYVLTPDEMQRMIVFGATPPVMWIVSYAALKLLKEARGDEAEAAIGLALPGLFLGAFVTHEFSRVFPNMDATLDSAFGGLIMFAFASVLFLGLCLTKLAPQDERV
ncbi:MAG: DUF5367 family protein [Phycisphaerales bacterium]|nr:DUF5367 family protein [Hyphomonadaceae bacterium]